MIPAAAIRQSRNPDQRTPDPETPWSGRAVEFLASSPVVATTAIAFAIFAVVFFATSAPFSIPTVEQACGAPPLDVRAFSTADDVATFLDDCGTSGRSAYLRLQVADLLYPAVSGLFFASALARTWKHLDPRRPFRRLLVAIPLAGAAFDYLENVAVWQALAAYPSQSATDELLGIASVMKTATFWVAGLALIAGLVRMGIVAIVRRLRDGTRPPDSASMLE
ncbi:MAG: hypothetical protein AB8G26_20190 [Ilumatobacter sp.]